MKYMIKFDFMPICFSAYLIGWFYGKPINDVPDCTVNMTSCNLLEVCDQLLTYNLYCGISGKVTFRLR